MSVLLLAAIAVVTVGSRVVALAVLPPPDGPLAVVVERLPTPLFAALAALSLLGSEGAAPDPAMLAAVGCALVASRWSSLLLVLLAGLSGYAVVTVLL